MKNIRHIVKWSYWINPFGIGEQDEFISEDEAEKKTPWEINEDDAFHNPNTPMRIRPVIPTPMGFMPVTPYQSFSNAFQFWVGHTNFNITQATKDKIEDIPGVEILDVITRYQFRIAVGRVFESREVKLNIMKALDALPPKQGELNPHDMKLDEETEDKVNLIKYTMKDKFPFWAIYVMPNGEIDVSGSNTNDGFNMHLDLYKGAQELAGGVIYQYA